MDDLATFARHVARLAEARARLAAQVDTVPAGRGRASIHAEAAAVGARLAVATKQLELAESYAHYRDAGKWVGEPHVTTTAERAALRRANDRPIGPVEAAGDALA